MSGEEDYDEMLRKHSGNRDATKGSRSPKDENKQEEGEQTKQLSASERMKLIKQRRLEREQAKRAARSDPTLGDSDDDDGDAMAWVAKSREIQKEKKLAARRALLYADDEDEEEYKQEELQGLKIVHDVSDFKTGETAILTLKDEQMLVDGELNDAGDELVNISKAEIDKAELYKKRKKMSNKYDEIDYDDKTILKQYDDDYDTIKKSGFVLDTQGKATDTPEVKLAKIKEKLQHAKMKRYTLEVKKKKTSEYYTPQEMAQFKKIKKPKKKRKKRKIRKPQSVVDIIGDGADKGDETDLATRRDRKRKHAQNKLDKQLERIDDKGSYANAIKKAERKSKMMLDDMDDIEEEEDDMLFEALARQRKRVKEKQDAAKILKKVEQTQKERELREKAAKEEGGLELTALNEFVQSIPAQVEEPSRKRGREPESQDSSDDDEDEPPQKRRKREKGEISDDDEDDDQDQKMEDSVVQPEEDDKFHLMSGGVGNFLNYIKSQGGISAMGIDTKVGRRTDRDSQAAIDSRYEGPRIEHLDAKGRRQTQREAFRELSWKFHGKRPSKNKIEKKLKKEAEELKRKMAMVGDTPLGTVKAMRKKQKRTGEAFVMMQGGTKKIVSEMKEKASLGVVVGKKKKRKKR